MRQRLRDAKSELSPERTLSLLRRIQHHRATLGNQTMAGVSSMTPEQIHLFAALGLQIPTKTDQLTLL
jgi:hypothetical protein